MNHSRFYGFLWGFLCGGCLIAGLTVHPVLLALALIPLAGNYLFKHAA